MCSWGFKSLPPHHERGALPAYIPGGLFGICLAGIAGGGLVLAEVIFWLAVITGAAGAFMVEGAPYRSPARPRGFVLVLTSIGILLFLALRGWD